MIIYNLANFFLNALIGLFSMVELPSFPDVMINVTDLILEMYSFGVGILGCFIDLDYVLILFELVLGIETLLFLYKVFMFLFRKIPFLGIK